MEILTVHKKAVYRGNRQRDFRDEDACGARTVSSGVRVRNLYSYEGFAVTEVCVPENSLCGKWSRKTAKSSHG